MVKVNRGTAGAASELVTFQGAAEVISVYARRLADGLAAQEVERWARAGRLARRQPWYRRGISIDQVRYAADAIARVTHTTTGRGDSSLLDPVEVSFVAVILAIRMLGVTGGARMWAKLGSHAADIRQHLQARAPMALAVDDLGGVAVLPIAEAEALEYLCVDLPETRRIVDALLAERRQAQPWEWVGHRRVPADELQAVG